MKNPTVVTITGPSCSGKSYLAEALSNTGHFRKAVSTTTRLPRPGEVSGVHYHFLSHDSFALLDESGDLLESVSFSGERYGLSAGEVAKAFNEGKVALVVCDHRGAVSVSEYCRERQWHCVTAFLDIDRDVAVSRFLDRFSNEPHPESVREHYARRLVKVVTEERAWGSQVDYDLRLPPSNDEHDTRVQIRLISESAWLAGVPEPRSLKKLPEVSDESLHRERRLIEKALDDRLAQGRGQSRRAGGPEP